VGFVATPMQLSDKGKVISEVDGVSSVPKGHPNTTSNPQAHIH
jgi:hypothetical protein